MEWIIYVALIGFGTLIGGIASHFGRPNPGEDFARGFAICNGKLYKIMPAEAVPMPAKIPDGIGGPGGYVAGTGPGQKE